jgi:hypothetical protein
MLVQIQQKNMKKAIFSVVCFVALFAMNTQAQVETKTVIGDVIKAEYSLDMDLASVYLQLLSSDKKDIYLSSTNEDAGFDKLPAIDESLIGKKIKATYDEMVEREIVEFRPSTLPEGIATRGKAVEANITVYSIEVTQQSVEETSMGWEVTAKTAKGTSMVFLADEMVFNGKAPSTFNDQLIKISYIEIEEYELKSFEVIK